MKDTTPTHLGLLPDTMPKPLDPDLMLLNKSSRTRSTRYVLWKIALTIANDPSRGTQARIESSEAGHGGET